MRTTEERISRIMEKAKVKERERKKKRKISVISAVSIGLALILAVNLTLFIPYSVGGVDISAYKSSEYYPLIKKIDELTTDRHVTNNFKEWGLDFSFGDNIKNGEEMVPPADDLDSSSNRAEGNFSDNWMDGNFSDWTDDDASGDGSGNSGAESPNGSWGDSGADGGASAPGNNSAEAPNGSWGDSGADGDAAEAPNGSWGDPDAEDPSDGDASAPGADSDENTRPQEPSGDSDPDNSAEKPGSSEGDGDPSGGNSGQNQEVTNNQVKGVIEGDLFKRSNDYIWYLRWSSSDWNGSGVNTTRMFLSAYSIQGYESKRVSDFIIDPDAGMDFMSYNGNDKEMYLSADGTTVTIISSCYNLTFDEKGNPNPFYYNHNSKPYTVIISLDVSNPKSPKETTRRYVSGGLVSSRLVDGTFLLVTEFMFTKPDFSKQEEYLPQMGEIGKMRSIPMRDIVLPENADRTFYTILSTFYEKSLESMDSVAFFSGAYAVYVSRNHVFTARSYSGTVENGAYSSTMSEIFCISYRNGLKLKGSFSVEGTALNQYSFDEKGGVLRVFTTSTRNRIYPANSKRDVYYEPSPPSRTSRCNLFCVRLSDFTPVASVLDFAPVGESIRAVRFDGNKAYVCTAVYNTDPVFEFDLSDYSHITSKDTGTISGFSMNLAKFYDDTLLGIGYGESQLDLKIEVYDANDTSVTSVAKFELENVDFFTDFKDYFIDRERGLIGFTIYQHLYPSYTYYTAFILLRFNGESFEIVLEEEGYYYGTRACIVDDYIYILDGYSFTVEKIYWG